MYYNVRQPLLRSRTGLRHKVRSQSGVSKLLKSRAITITKWGNRYYKIEQVLQNRANLLKGGACITSCGNYYKLGQIRLHINSHRKAQTRSVEANDSNSNTVEPPFQIPSIVPIHLQQLVSFYKLFYPKCKYIFEDFILKFKVF